MEIQQLEKELAIRFDNHELIKQAFTHSSYVNEHRNETVVDNERLEFLGDAVLELGVSQYLFNENAEMPEGEMTKLRAAIVCEPSLVNFARDLDFGKFIRLGKGEEQTGGRERPALLADVFEAFLGALYLDKGYSEALAFLERHVFPKITTGAFSHAMDYKSQLQELVQQYRHQTITYRIIDETGPSHDREFLAEVQISEKVTGTGKGRTKKEAEQRAAKAALDKYQP
ncbi:ribonuclease 3 [Oceanobacillus picturae]|uniref:Ribonuclease 3 n=1 Tax=Oceanobacillus picturae TaxID=171693 RepID=W9AHW5_9BACI|nr:ribonuclease III [Oceanobacillus picturae]RIU96399.1 ribonuclease III [Oceanobacillus picturae]GAQ17817.1 ribonuclease 3 [Oceanobacillus picturae]CDO02266.1 Ribonuclease 3 [Oceanobacillus picturae]